MLEDMKYVGAIATMLVAMSVRLMMADAELVVAEEATLGHCTVTSISVNG